MPRPGQSVQVSSGHARPQRPAGARGGIRAFLLALGMHALLFALLFVGVRWQTQPPTAMQVELWTPPALAEPTPPATTEPVPPPVEQPMPAPAPAPAPAPPPVPPKVAPLPRPDIALERDRQEKQRREDERLRQEAQATKEREAKEREAKARKEARALKEAQAKKEAQEKKDAQEKKQAQDRKLAQEKLAQDRKDAQEKKENERREAEKAREQQRRHDEYVKRMVTEAGPGERPAQAGAPTGGAVGGASGAANADYAAKVASLIRANTVFVVPPDLAGNPKAVFLVTLLPDCSIASVKLRRSSGHAGWDQAAERGIARTDPMPRMPGGKCPPELEIARGPRDDR